MKKWIALLLILATLCSLAAVPAAAKNTESVAAAADPVEQMVQNFRSAIADGTLRIFAYPRNNYSTESNLGYLVTDTDGTMYFSNVKYDVNDFVKLTDHLARTLTMAVTYNATENQQLKARLGEVIPALVAYWVKNDYQCSNWWYNEINTPNLLSEIALLVREKLTDAQLKGVLAIVGDGCFTLHSDLLDETGANAVWLTYATLKYGMLADNENIVKQAVAKLKETLAFSSGEGIRADGTFLQHGARLYNGAYGVSLIENTASILRILTGTAYALTEEQLTALSALILDGTQYMSIGNLLDPQTVGRDISRKNGTDNSGLADSLEKLMLLDTLPRKTETAAYITALTDNTRRDLGLKYYPEAAFTVINNSDFYFSYRSAAANLYYAENLNNENILSYNSSYGTTTTIAGTNVNFNDLQPVMDYALVPGTTAVYEDDDALLSYTDYNKRKLKGTFGGADYGDAVVSFAQTTHEKISYTVACFATGNSALLLGAGIKDADGRQMYTTLQQELANGSYLQEGNTVIHNGVKYTLYQGGTLQAEIKTQTGSWRRNRVSGVTDECSQEVFTLKLADTGSYAYAVMGENTQDEYKIIVNTTDVQAVVLPDGALCAAFYTDASFTYNGICYTGKAGGSLYIPADADLCLHTETVALTENGTYLLNLNGTDLGKYTLTAEGSGWTLTRPDGNAIVVDKNGNLSYGKTGTVFSYNGNFYVKYVTKTKVLFWTTDKTVTYYLTCANGAPAVTQSAVSAALKREVVTGTHCCAYADNGNGTHRVYCTVCQKELQQAEPCSYNAQTHCCDCCGHADPEFITLKVSVNVTKKNGTKILFFSTKATYTAAVTVDCQGDTVTKTEYSTNGSSWKTGSTYTANSAITKLYVRVTLKNGGTSVWLYDGTATQRVS